MNNYSKKILLILIENSGLQSSQIHKKLQEDGEVVSLITIKREIASLLKNGFILQNGAGRYLNYNISIEGKLFLDIDSEKYVEIEPDNRFGLRTYNFNLFDEFPLEIITKTELEKLNLATDNFHSKSKNISTVIEKKELERLIIELSWKSSKIEGNTYTLLDTEKLILENKEAEGKSKLETQMILNHKFAFEYIWNNKDIFKSLTKEKVERVHEILTKSLDIKVGYRTTGVGVNGSIYKPLDNLFQIEDSMEKLFSLLEKILNPYDKALVLLAGISYIQPFEDGNKRTSRLLTNAILLNCGLAPLSYRSIDIEKYRAAMLTFYELNSIIPIKNIFINQYIEAANNYLIKNSI